VRHVERVERREAQLREDAIQELAATRLLVTWQCLSG
jgi:hypothetical protein